MPSAAAFAPRPDHINLSAPALNRRIDKLETSLGARQFHRTRRDVELTPPSRVFRERARTVLDNLEPAMLHDHLPQSRCLRTKYADSDCCTCTSSY